MTTNDQDTGIIITILESFEKQRLPRVIEIKKRLDEGHELNEFEIEYLSEALHDSELFLPFLERNQEYQQLFSQVIHFYKSVTDEASKLG